MIFDVYYKFKAMTGGLLRVLLTLAFCGVCCLLVQSILTGTAADTISLACVDRDRTDISEEVCEVLQHTDGLAVTLCSREEAAALLRKGRADGILLLDVGFSEAFLSGEQMPVSFRSAGGSVSSRAVVEIVSAAVLSVQSRYDAESRLTADDLWNEEAEALFDEKWQEAEENTREIVVYETKGKRTEVTETPAFGEFYTGYSGIAGMLVLLCMLSLSAWLAEEGSELVRRRGAVFPFGRIRSMVTDFGAVFVLGLLLVLCVLLCKGSSRAEEWFAWLCYLVCLTGVVLALRRINVSGGIQVAAPFLAVITSVLGGCFFDFTALGGLAAYLPHLTPQGHLIRAVGGEPSSAWVLLGVGLLLSLLGI